MSHQVLFVYEDSLSKTVMEKILKEFGSKFTPYKKICGHGFGYIKKNILNFNKAAQYSPILVLTDLDNDPCAPQKMNDWLAGYEKSSGLLFRIAVKEIESWILADRNAFSSYFGCPMEKISVSPDTLLDPKRDLILLVDKYSKKEIKLDVLPRKNDSIKQGPNYNARMEEFVLNNWDVSHAVIHSPSLQRTFLALKKYTHHVS